VRLVRVKKAPAQPGKAIQAKWTTRHELAKLRALIVKARKQGDLRTWRRGKAVRDYINGKKWCRPILRDADRESPCIRLQNAESAVATAGSVHGKRSAGCNPA
jgi:hypothetical protein